MEDKKLKFIELANEIFPDIVETVEDLEKRYPERNLKEGAEVTRYAPSPTGFLHTGALFTALINFKIAEQTGGIFYFRNEDTDRKREIEDSISLLTKELKKMGIVHQEGVVSGSEEIGPYGPYTQSSRGQIYKICAKYLIGKGLAYPCFCTHEILDITRKNQEDNKIRPGYYGTYARCRNIPVDEQIRRVKAGERFVLRFRSNGNHLKKVSFFDQARGKIEMAQNDLDIVIVKSDDLPTYHFAHVVDDHFMRTTLIIRGEEWLPSVPIDIEVFEAMGFKLTKYAHIPTVMINDGNSKRKLSKRKDKEASISYFFKAGYTVESILEYLMTIINSDFEAWRVKNPDTDLMEFNVRLEKLNSAGALFDLAKLNDISKEIIAKMKSEEVLSRAIDWSKEYDNEIFNLLNRDFDFSKNMFAIERDGAQKIRKDLVKWEDVRPNFFYFFEELFLQDIKESGLNFEDNQNAIIVLEEYIKAYNPSDDKDKWFSNMKYSAERLGFSPDMKQYKQNPEKYAGSIADFSGIIRLAITNRKNTPDIYQIMKLLSKDVVIKRLSNALEITKNI